MEYRTLLFSTRSIRHSSSARAVSDTPLQHAQYRTHLFSTCKIGHSSSARAVSDTPLQHVQDQTLLFSTCSIRHTPSARGVSDTPLQHAQYRTNLFSTNWHRLSKNGFTGLYKYNLAPHIFLSAKGINSYPAIRYDRNHAKSMTTPTPLIPYHVGCLPDGDALFNRSSLHIVSNVYILQVSAQEEMD